MKKLMTFILFVVLFTYSNVISIHAAATWSTTSKASTDLGYGITLDVMKGTSTSDYNNITKQPGREQTIYTASISKDSPARVVQWSKFSGVENSWGSFTLEMIAEDYEQKHPGEKVIVATNNWLASTKSNNRGELDSVQIAGGLNYRVSDTQGTNESCAFYDYVIPRPNFLGFDATGKKAYYTRDWNNDKNYTEDLYLSFYNEDGTLSKLNIKVDKVNEAPSDGEVAIYFKNATIPSFENARIYKMKGLRLLHDMNDNVPFNERDAFALGTFVSTVDNLDFNPSTAGAYAYYFVSRNKEFDALDLNGKQVVCQYELLGEFQNVVGGTTFYGHIVRDGETYPGSFGTWSEINCEVHPRTAFIIKEDGTFALSVIDGRQKGATGMDYMDMANFYKTNYNAYQVFNYDGGGSSCMVVANQDGGFKVINSPSDGSERRVANATLIVVDEAPFDVTQIQPNPNTITLNITKSNPNITNLKACCNGITKEVDDTVTFDGLTKDTLYSVAFTYELDGKTCIGKTVNAKTCKEFAYLYEYDIKLIDQSSCLITTIIADDDETFFQAYLEMNKKKYYINDLVQETLITGLISSTEYECNLFIESANGTINKEVTKTTLPKIMTSEARFPDDFILDIKKGSILIGEKTSVVITPVPANTYTLYTYESSDESVAKVNENGKVEGIGEGICEIIVTSKQGVSKKIAVEVILQEEVIKEEKKGCNCKKNNSTFITCILSALSFIYIIRKRK